MFRRAADAPALKRAAAYQKALLDLDQLAGRFPQQLGKAMEAHANVLDAVDAHKRHLFEYGHTKKAEKSLEAMEGLLSRETRRKAPRKRKMSNFGCPLLTKRVLDEKVNEERRREVEEHDEATV